MKDMIIVRPCVFCRKLYEVEINSYEYGLWEDGLLIQQAMPEEPAEVREFLISGICPTCQAKFFDDDDDEDFDFDDDEDFDFDDDDFDEDFDFSDFVTDEDYLPF